MTLRKVQRIMERKFARIDPKVLKDTWLFGGTQNGLGMFKDTPGERTRMHQELVFGASPSAIGPASEAFGCPDLQDDPGYHRVDLALRPRILTEFASPGQLKKEVTRLTRASGLICGVGIDRMTRQEVDELLDLTDGVRIPLPEALQSGSPGATESADAT